MVIDISDMEIRRLINLELLWRRQVMKDAESSQILNILQHCGGTMTRQQLMDECIMLGLDVRKVNAIVESLRKSGLIITQGDTIILRTSTARKPDQ